MKDSQFRAVVTSQSFAELTSPELAADTYTAALSYDCSWQL